MNDEIKATFELPKRHRELEERIKAIEEWKRGELKLHKIGDAFGAFRRLSDGALAASLAFNCSPFAGFFQAAIEANQIAEEKKVRKAMEHGPGYSTANWPFGGEVSISYTSAPTKDEYTYVITTPTNDRIEVKAADCFIEKSGCLLFEDDDEVTVYAIAPGHWVKVERLEEEEKEE